MTDIAPVEYIVINFPGNRFTGEIAPALADLVDQRVVRVLDLVFVKKDGDGTVTTFEYDQLDEVGAFATIDGEAGDLLSDDDVAELATTIPTDSSALFIVWEDLWAADLARAIRRAGGEVIDGGRIPHEIIHAVVSPDEPQEVTS